jgi:heme/copper-type cytochrome/quinol oxidase subunit 2
MAGFGMFGMLLGITLSAYSVDVLLMEQWPFLAKDYWVEAGLANTFHILQTNILSILTLVLPVVGGLAMYFLMKWRGSIKDGTPGYEHKLSASYFKIR